MYKTINAFWTGTEPLIIRQRSYEADAKEKLAEIRKLSSSKDPEDQAKMEFADYSYSLYYDPKMGPYVPNRMILAVLRSAGAEDGAVRCPMDKIAIGYAGPRTPEEMWEDENYVIQAPVRIKGKDRTRTRPIFHQWRLLLTLEYDDTRLDRADVLELMRKAGRECGMGENRPQYGMFDVKLVE